MSSIGTIEDIMRGAMNGGWEWFERVDPEIRKRIEPVLARLAEDKRTIAGAWARFAASDDGAIAIQALLDATLFRTVFFVDLGTDPEAMKVFGAFREGQNALAHEIVRQIMAGRETEDQLKPRDTTNETISATSPGKRGAAVGGGRSGGRRGGGSRRGRSGK